LKTTKHFPEGTSTRHSCIDTPTPPPRIYMHTRAGFSGAQLANLVNEGALLAARHNADSITTALLDEARDKILMGSPR
jgi:cell division protease FtsH